MTWQEYRVHCLALGVNSLSDPRSLSLSQALHQDNNRLFELEQCIQVTIHLKQAERSSDENAAAPLPNSAPRQEALEADPKPPYSPPGVAEKVAHVAAPMPKVAPSLIASWLAARNINVHPVFLRIVMSWLTLCRVYCREEFSNPSVTMQTLEVAEVECCST